MRARRAEKQIRDANFAGDDGGDFAHPLQRVKQVDAEHFLPVSANETFDVGRASGDCPLDTGPVIQAASYHFEYALKT